MVFSRREKKGIRVGGQPKGVSADAGYRNRPEPEKRIGPPPRLK